jgi:hypothetical protein
MNDCYEFKSSQPSQEDKKCALNDIDEDQGIPIYMYLYIYMYIFR